MTTILKILLLLVIAMGLSQVQAQVVSDSEAGQVVQPRVIRGNDQVTASSAAGAGQISGAVASFKFEDTPLSEIVSLVLREIVKVDYVVHPPLAGTVTLSTQGDVTADTAMLLLEAALQANGIQMARDTRGIYHIGRPDIIKGIVPAVRQAVTGSTLPPGFGAIVIPLKYIGAGEMAAILRPMVPPEAILRVDSVRNLMVMVGTRNQAEGWLSMVSTFDVDLLKGMSVGVFPLKHVTTQEVDIAMRALNSGGTSSAPPAAASAGNSAAAGAGGLSPAFPLFGALRVIPIERINSIMVITPRAAYLEEARRWIEKLDQPGGNSAEAQLFTFPVQNGNAKHLADVLNGLFGTGAAANTSVASGVAPGLQQTTVATSGFAGANFGGTAGASQLQNSISAANQAGSTIKGSGVSAVTLGGGLRVMADEINNSILVYGNKSEYEKVEATLKRLDVPPNQVLIEASIIEVTLTDDLRYGLQWVFNDPARGGLAGVGVLSSAAGAAFGSTPAGFSYTLSNAAGEVRAVLNALAEKSLVKVISSPSLMVLDNHMASISVGNQQPVQVGQTVSTGGNVTNNIQYKDTGVNLSVTPSVNAGNMVTMQLTQAVTDVGSVDTATGQRSFLQRQFSSKVAVRSGESLVLGGLIRDNTSSGKSGLPLLQDIPVLGALFGARNTSVNRTELMVIITPRVVRTEQDVRAVGQQLKDRMKTLFPPKDE